MQFVKNAIIFIYPNSFFCFSHDRADKSSRNFLQTMNTVGGLNADSANNANRNGFYKIYPRQSARSAESAFKNSIFNYFFQVLESFADKP